jgi:hypothetical protein
MAPRGMAGALWMTGRRFELDDEILASWLMSKSAGFFLGPLNDIPRRLPKLEGGAGKICGMLAIEGAAMDAGGLDV